MRKVLRVSIRYNVSGPTLKDVKIGTSVFNTLIIFPIEKQNLNY